MLVCAETNLTPGEQSWKPAGPLFTTYMPPGFFVFKP